MPSPSRILVRLVATAALAGVVLWAGAVALLHSERRALIYRFDRWPNSATAEAGVGRFETVEGADGTPVTLWVSEPRDGRPTVLHFMGNAGVMRRAVRRFSGLAADGYGVVIMNYRGAGGMPGRPSEAAIVADALAVHDALPEIAGVAAPPVVYGASLGAAVAVRVAAERPVAGVILAAPFARLCETAEHHHPWAPACLVLTDERWDSIGRIGRIGAPLLVVHGEADRIVPLSHGRRLFEAAPEPKRLVVLEGAGHRAIGGPETRRAVRAFLDRLSPPRGG